MQVPNYMNADFVGFTFYIIPRNTPFLFVAGFSKTCFGGCEYP